MGFGGAVKEPAQNNFLSGPSAVPLRRFGLGDYLFARGGVVRVRFLAENGGYGVQDATQGAGSRGSVGEPDEIVDIDVQVTQWGGKIGFCGGGCRAAEVNCLCRGTRCDCDSTSKGVWWWHKRSVSDGGIADVGSRFGEC